MFGLHILVRVAPDKRHEFLHTFKLLSQSHRRDRACLGHRLFEEAGEPHCFLWVEDWSSSGALERHLNSDRFRTLLGAIEVLGELEDLKIVQCNSLADPMNASNDNKN